MPAANSNGEESVTELKGRCSFAGDVLGAAGLQHICWGLFYYYDYFLTAAFV